jgi:sec-independent protein translocase protein TatA
MVAVILLIIALILFGPGKLPELGKSLGRGIKEFKDATEGPAEAAPVAPAQVAAPVQAAAQPAATAETEKSE